MRNDELLTALENNIKERFMEFNLTQARDIANTTRPEKP